MSRGASPVYPSTVAERPDIGQEKDATFVRGIGFVEPETELRRLAFRLEGVVSECLVQVGQRVSRGTVLMTLSNADERAAVAVARQELGLAHADRDKLLSGVNRFEIVAAERKIDLLKEQVRYGKKHLERIAKLHTTKAATTAELDECETDVVQAEASLAQAEADLNRLQNFVRTEDHALADVRVQLAQARLALAEERLQNTILTAPLDGTVLELLKREGEGNQGRQPVIVFGDEAHTRVRAEIDERYVHLARTGQTAVIHGSGVGSRRFTGTVAVVKRIMGKKTVFSREAEERKDLDVLQVLIDMPADFRAPLGLQVDVDLEML